jgi:DNA-binding transcriptional MerR regulator
MADKVKLPEGQEEFKLNEVCKLANVQPYMLRFWGTEFDQLEAAKSGTGQRLYTRDQVGMILEIRRLLFDEGLTIAGARKRINAMDDGADEPKPKKAKAAAKKKTPAKKKAAPDTADEPEPEQEELELDASEDEVDKDAPADVQPLLATLEDVRAEVAKIVKELRE